MGCHILNINHTSLSQINLRDTSTQSKLTAADSYELFSMNKVILATANQSHWMRKTSQKKMQGKISHDLINLTKMFWRLVSKILRKKIGMQKKK